MVRRQAIAIVVLAGLGISIEAAAESDADVGVLPRLAVLDFELIDEQNNPLTKSAQEVRLRNASAQLRHELADRRLYRIVDETPSHDLEERVRSQHAFLYRCGDCAQSIGKSLGVDLVMTPWVQKVSELILNLNVEIYDVTSDRVVLIKSVDMRGNEDESWSRAVRYLVRDMAEKRARDRNYGR
ncbi:MAG TPA: DUF3280 domain-containing protein [Casimicrobiaceae bacterium]|nr:DUF3280 domain-containing protein [Casimicrobiaceae bacterium]